MGIFSSFVSGLSGESDEELRKKLEDYRKNRGQIWNDLGRDFREAVQKDMKELAPEIEKAQREHRERAQRFDSFLTDPNALDKLSPAELDLERIRAKSEIDAAEDAISQNQRAIDFADHERGILSGMNADVATGANFQFKEIIRKRKLLLELIEAKKNRRTEPPPSPNRDEKRLQLQGELKRLEEEKHKMVDASNDEDMKHRIGNLYDDKVAKVVEELRHYL
jgi:hypothetical protein